MELNVYHALQKLVAIKESLTGLILSNENVANLITWVVYGQKRECMVGNILHDIYDDQ